MTTAIKISKKISIELHENSLLDHDLDLVDSDVTKLPNNMSVAGDVDLYATAITEIPYNLVIQGDLDIRKTNIKRLPDCLVVRGKIYIDEDMDPPTNLRSGTTFVILSELGGVK